MKELQQIPAFNPKHEQFDPENVLDLLEEKGEEPQKAMTDFADWVKEHTKGHKAVEAAAPIKFDGMFTGWYFDNFYSGENPLGYSGFDIQSFYRGKANDMDADFSKLLTGLPHNALEDAIMQAKAFEKILEGCKGEF